MILRCFLTLAKVQPHISYKKKRVFPKGLIIITAGMSIRLGRNVELQISFIIFYYDEINEFLYNNHQVTPLSTVRHFHSSSSIKVL